MKKIIDFIAAKLRAYQEKDLKIFASSSFQTHSIPMLHLIGQYIPETPIVFLNTGFHFPETLMFRDQIANLLNLNIVNVESNISKIAQRDANNRFLFASDPDYCCYLNKTLPMEAMLIENDIWINGVRKDQSANRKNFEYEVKGPHNTLRFHPMLEWTSKMIWDYRQQHQLPEHPLEKEGYLSVGCAPCTTKYIDEGRGGRWAGMKKTECGLHTNLVAKS
ncbi:phosphoadenylyl-sulfate reductase [Akkermansiaceae bacterium]|nr:phosphoadenylyl-sulfate reductase [Akkermansiaceae bacterium]MDB4790226.1 phosphoadenylyl-sulfate reductase [Akkermansiaceae bacterium]